MSAEKDPPKVLIAVEHFSYETDGQPRFVHAGDRLASDHPAVKGRESLFREKADTD